MLEVSFLWPLKTGNSCNFFIINIMMHLKCHGTNMVSCHAPTCTNSMNILFIYVCLYMYIFGMYVCMCVHSLYPLRHSPLYYSSHSSLRCISHPWCWFVPIHYHYSHFPHIAFLWNICTYPHTITSLLSHGHFIFVKAQALLFKQACAYSWVSPSLPCSNHLDL